MSTRNDPSDPMNPADVEGTCVRISNLGRDVLPPRFERFIMDSGLSKQAIRYIRCAPGGFYGFVACISHEDAIRLFDYVRSTTPRFGVRVGTHLKIEWSRPSSKAQEFETTANKAHRPKKLPREDVKVSLDKRGLDTLILASTTPDPTPIAKKPRVDMDPPSSKTIAPSPPPQPTQPSQQVHVVDAEEYARFRVYQAEVLKAKEALAKQQQQQQQPPQVPVVPPTETIKVTVKNERPRERSRSPRRRERSPPRQHIPRRRSPSPRGRWGTRANLKPWRPLHRDRSPPRFHPRPRAVSPPRHNRHDRRESRDRPQEIPKHKTRSLTPPPPDPSVPLEELPTPASTPISIEEGEIPTFDAQCM